MARFVFFSSSHCKVLFLLSCITALLQAPIALAQRGAPHFGGGGQLGGGGHFAGGARVTAPHVTTPNISVPPPMRAPTPPFRFLGGPHPTNLGASYFRFRGRPIRPRPVLPIVPFPVFVGGPFVGYWPGYGFNSLWWPSCAAFWVWRFGCNAILTPYYGYDSGGFISPYASPNIAPPEYAPPPSYLYGADESRQRPELYLKDGTVYSVTDYWLINGQIHFTTLEQGGTKAVEHVIPFEDLDLQQTIDVNTQMGFRFVLRNAPIEQYLRDRNERKPPAETAPPQEN